jgi:phage terminase large subunit
MVMIKTYDIYKPLYEDDDHFIFLITGGRGSGKTFGVSTFINRLTFECIKNKGERDLVHQILYTRYTMASASISIIPEFIEKTELDDTRGCFKNTKTDVVNTWTGSHVMFRGIKTSSGNQTAKLKSIYGITTFICDEAEEWVSEREFDTLMLSIRQKGIRCRIIIIMNPTDSNHWVYKRFIEKTHRLVEYDGVPVQISTHPDVMHIHTTYLDNIGHLSGQFLKEAESMKNNNPEKYAHTMMGRWADVAEGAVFKKWGIVDEFPEECRHVARGLDLGFTHDPSACVKCGVWGNDLYIDEQFYQTGMLISDLTRELKKDKTHIFSESADPRLVQELSNTGLIIYPVDKSKMSIVAGIERMKDFDNIFVTRRSYNVQNELRNYTWAKDKNGNYINEPIDANNHAIDAVRYYVVAKLLGHILKPKTRPNYDLPIF